MDDEAGRFAAQQAFEIAGIPLASA